MGFQGRWSCGHRWSHLSSKKKRPKQKPSTRCLPIWISPFLWQCYFEARWTHCIRRQRLPLRARRSATPSAAPSRLMVGHIRGKKLLFYFPETIRPQPGSFYWSASTRVERWRTSKRCSPMSVIWWRWRRANRLQRPERARKSSCPNPGNHINSELSCRVAAQGLFVCLQSGCMFFFFFFPPPCMLCSQIGSWRRASSPTCDLL